MGAIPEPIELKSQLIQRYNKIINIEIKHSKDVIQSIASKLKSKGSVSADDLSILLQALANDSDHIILFFNEPGALHGLIRELSGNDGNKRLLAIGCVGNLSLGPPRKCLTLTKTAGAYLTTYLHSHNNDILELCIWTLGNLISSSENSATIIKNQGFLDCILSLYNPNTEDKIIDVILYSINMLLLKSWNILEPVEIESIAKTIISSHYKSSRVFWSLYLLSDKNYALDIFTLNSVLENVIKELINFSNLPLNKEYTIAVNCLIRTAANICSDRKYIKKNAMESIYSESFQCCMNKLLQNSHSEIRNESLWLLGNIFNNTEDSHEKQSFFTEMSNLILI